MHEFSAKDIDGRMVNLDKYRWVLAHLVGAAGVGGGQDRSLTNGQPVQTAGILSG